LITDLPVEGYARVVYRICRFLGTAAMLPSEGSRSLVSSWAEQQSSAGRAAQCASTLSLPNTKAHGSVYARAACEDELVRGILADPPLLEVHRVAFGPFTYQLPPEARRSRKLAAAAVAIRNFRRNFRRRRLRLQAIHLADNNTGRTEVRNRENIPEGVLGACALLRRSGTVGADAPVLALTQHSATTTFGALIDELANRFAPHTKNGLYSTHSRL
jgi:hypothetical protein